MALALWRGTSLRTGTAYFTLLYFTLLYFTLLYVLQIISILLRLIVAASSVSFVSKLSCKVKA